jgi:antitoxin CptB
MTSKMEMTNMPSQAAEREHPDVRRRRLLFQCWHRGTQESDFILGPFAEDALKTLDSDQLVSDPPSEHDHDVMQLLRSFCIERHRTPRQIGQQRI